MDDTKNPPLTETVFNLAEELNPLELVANAQLSLHHHTAPADVPYGEDGVDFD